MHARFVVIAMTIVAGAAPTGALADTITFAEHVAPIFYNRCVACHRPNSVAPMSLLTYEEVRPWAKSIRKAVANRDMPPWDADPNVGTFTNDISLAPSEIDTIVSWVDQGALAGDVASAPVPPEFETGWRLGEPDYVVELPAYSVKATGDDNFPNVFLNLDIDQTKYLKAVEVRAGDPRIVHHIVMFKGSIALGDEIIDGRTIRNPKGIQAEGASVVYVWASGSPPAVFPKGMGHSFEPGQTISVNIHYHPFGDAASDSTRLGLHFTDEPLEKEITTAFAANPSLRIPPHTKGYQQHAYFTFHQDSQIVSFLPHMHTRGDSMRYVLHFPNGEQQDVLNVPRYDYDWQWIYYPEEPIRAPKGTSMEVIARYDNTAENDRNPDPSQWVKFGDGTDDEMLIGFAEFIVDEGVAPVYDSVEVRLAEAMRLRDPSDCFIVDTGLIEAGLYLPAQGDGMMYIIAGQFMVSSSVTDLKWNDGTAIMNTRMLTGAADSVAFGLRVTIEDDRLFGTGHPTKTMSPEHLAEGPGSGFRVTGERLTTKK